MSLYKHMYFVLHRENIERDESQQMSLFQLNYTTVVDHSLEELYGNYEG